MATVSPHANGARGSPATGAAIEALSTGGALAGTVVLDVAGGKGDLAWLLANADGADAVVADPRLTDHSKVARASRDRFMLLRSREHANRGRGEQYACRGWAPCSAASPGCTGARCG